MGFVCVVVTKRVTNGFLLMVWSCFDPYVVTFLITCHFLFLPLFQSFSQFNIKCGREWVSVVPLTGRPIKLCGSQPPAPFEVTGGNVTVMHHFFPHFYPISGFYLYYIKGRYKRTIAVLALYVAWHFWNVSKNFAKEFNCVCISLFSILQTQVPVFQASLNVTVNVVSLHHGVVMDGSNALARGMNLALTRTDAMTSALNLT